MLIYKRADATIRYTVSRYTVGSYGDWIRRRRLELDLTQEELAKRLGVNEMTVVSWERGWHEPCPRLRQKLRLTVGHREVFRTGG